MTTRIVIWLGVLIGASGCLDSHPQPSELGGDNLSLQTDAGATKPPIAGSVASCDTPPKPAADANDDECWRKAKECYGRAGDPAECASIEKTCAAKPAPPRAPQGDVEQCYAKAKDCFGVSDDPAACDALLKSCSSLSEEPKPQQDGCVLKGEECQKSAKGASDCIQIKLDCMQKSPGS